MSIFDSFTLHCMNGLSGTKTGMWVQTMKTMKSQKARPPTFCRARLGAVCKENTTDAQVMGVVGPSSVADGLPLLHLSPYLSPPLPFSTAVVRLVALQIQALKDEFPLSHVISPFTNQERREGMLLNLLIPFVLTVGSGSKGTDFFLI
ncbi:protein unc-80 homolog [Mastacembelus armatus]|uniref:protein unc-80 homolog n=1 Tax=Mastacembelus armatus TaxID=205130 RepID=UPI000E45BBE3|nr:protein unc-80 homolog [Mastacembelus armatus]